jgi:beta-galactosidase
MNQWLGVSFLTAFLGASSALPTQQAASSAQQTILSAQPSASSAQQAALPAQPSNLSASPSAASAPQAPAPFLIDARTPASAPETGFLQMGGRSPSGHSLAVNSRSLLLDGKPWLPVMGEFHYSRYPEKYWREELLKMKAGGVQVVSTYVFWIHHEEIEGHFDWSGQRDLRRFVELCQESGLSVYLRIGPWDHGEARNGGFPDWLLAKKIPLRRNDPAYLKYVGRFYDQIGAQIKGQLWQQGGSIVGVQIENEYGLTGPGAGAEHLTTLKRMAIAAGIDPPLFSVTGWPGHDYPMHAVFPVSGGYPDDFWTSRMSDAPPNPVYLFSTDRKLENMGDMAMGDPDGKIDLGHYPNFAAEQGGGMEPSYHRRPLLQADDIRALTLTALGSGVNLYGYYMFQGGANPRGRLSTLDESIATGYLNDLPVVNYDYQAPLSEYGQERASFRKIKSLHLFLHAFGPELAGMTPYPPDKTPHNAADASLPRLMLRSSGEHGFLFVSNYVRKLEMPARRGFQVEVKLPSGTVELPRTPVDLPANSSCIWPVNLDLGAGTLQSSTAQLLTRLDGPVPTYFFFALPGLRVEFAFDAASVASVAASGSNSAAILPGNSSGNSAGMVTRSAGSILVEDPQPDRNTVLQVSGKNGRRARIVLLTEAEAEQLWLLPMGNPAANPVASPAAGPASDPAADSAAGKQIVLLSPADLFADTDGVHLRSTDPARLTALIFQPDGQQVAPTSQPETLWRSWSGAVPPRTLHFTWSLSRPAAPRPSIRMNAHVAGRDRPMPQAPEEADFAAAALWSLQIPAQSMTGLSDLYLRIHYAGDVARLTLDGRLLDDDFYNGSPWEIGLKRYLPAAFGQSLELSVLPLPPHAPIYLDPQAQAQLNPNAQTAKVMSIDLLPEYEAVLKLAKP